MVHSSPTATDTASVVVLVETRRALAWLERVSALAKLSAQEGHEVGAVVLSLRRRAEDVGFLDRFHPG